MADSLTDGQLKIIELLTVSLNKKNLVEADTKNLSQFLVSLIANPELSTTLDAAALTMQNQFQKNPDSLKAFEFLRDICFYTRHFSQESAKNAETEQNIIENFRRFAADRDVGKLSTHVEKLDSHLLQYDPKLLKLQESAQTHGRYMKEIELAIHSKMSEQAMSHTTLFQKPRENIIVYFQALVAILQSKASLSPLQGSNSK